MSGLVLFCPMVSIAPMNWKFDGEHKMIQDAPFHWEIYIYRLSEPTLRDIYKRFIILL